MKLLAKKKLEHSITMHPGDTLSITYNHQTIVDHKQALEAKTYAWGVIFEHKGGICGGLFPKEPK